MSEKILTKEEQKAIAVECLKKIKSYGPYTNKFKTHNVITMYEGYGGYYLGKEYGSNEEELMDKIKEVEKEYGGTIYAVIHNFFDFGECYTMLYVSKYAEDAKYCVDDWGTSYGVYAYVWNKSVEEYSEFGTVAIKPALGGLLRIS